MKRLSALLGAVACLAAGCGLQIPEVPVGTPVSYSVHIEPLVTARCLGCHKADEPKAKLILEQGTGYEQLVGRRSVQVPEMMLVQAGEPESSYLWRKLQHATEVGKGMPRTLTGSKKLQPAELDLYRRWISDGALP